MIKIIATVSAFAIAAASVTAAVTAPIILLAASRPAFAADAKRGQNLWEARCTGCHSLDEDRIGPRHRGVFGRKAGIIPDFNYSSAVKNAGFVWDEVKLDAWLTNPQALLPGQRMNFRVAKPEDRADIISYLKSLSGPTKP